MISSPFSSLLCSLVRQGQLQQGWFNLGHLSLLPLSFVLLVGSLHAEGVQPTHLAAEQHGEEGLAVHGLPQLCRADHLDAPFLLVGGEGLTGDTELTGGKGATAGIEVALGGLQARLDFGRHQPRLREGNRARGRIELLNLGDQELSLGPVSFCSAIDRARLLATTIPGGGRSVLEFELRVEHPGENHYWLELRHGGAQASRLAVPFSLLADHGGSVQPMVQHLAAGEGIELEVLPPRDCSPAELELQVGGPFSGLLSFDLAELPDGSHLLSGRPVERMSARDTGIAAIPLTLTCAGTAFAHSLVLVDLGGDEALGPAWAGLVGEDPPDVALEVPGGRPELVVDHELLPRQVWPQLVDEEPRPAFQVELSIQDEITGVSSLVVHGRAPDGADSTPRGREFWQLRVPDGPRSHWIIVATAPTWGR